MKGIANPSHLKYYFDFLLRARTYRCWSQYQNSHNLGEELRSLFDICCSGSKLNAWFLVSGHVVGIYRPVQKLDNYSYSALTVPAVWCHWGQGPHEAIIGSYVVHTPAVADLLPPASLLSADCWRSLPTLSAGPAPVVCVLGLQLLGHHLCALMWGTVLLTLCAQDQKSPVAHQAVV